MGELLTCRGILGAGALRRCSNEMDWADRDCFGLDTGDVLAAVLASIIDRLDRREAEKGT